MTKKILLVEDNEMNRDMLSRRLVKRGYDVDIAVDGEQGLAMARLTPPALILMDMSLPGVDGWEATRQLKTMPETRSVPVIDPNGASLTTTGPFSSALTVTTAPSCFSG